MIEERSGLGIHWMLAYEQPELAGVFRRWREERELSQEQLAEQTGVKLANIQAVEAGKSKLKHRETWKIIRFDNPNPLKKDMTIRTGPIEVGDVWGWESIIRAHRAATLPKRQPPVLRLVPRSDDEGSE